MGNVSSPIAQDTTYIFYVTASGGEICASNEYRDSARFTLSPCIYGGCSDPESLNYNPLATVLDSLDCVYAEDENTRFIDENEIPGEIVDTVAVKPVEACDLTAGVEITSAIISNITSLGRDSVTAHWEITQDGKVFHFDVNYAVSQEGVTLFYLSIVCKNGTLRSTQNNITGFTVSAVYNVNFDDLTHIIPAEATASNVLAYPNPFSNWLNIMLKDAKNANIALYSLDGKTIANFHNESEVQIATSNLPAGSYVVKVTVNGKITTMTVIKK